MPDLSDTLRKCRIGTAKNFTLLLLLYHTQANGSEVYVYRQGSVAADLAQQVLEAIVARLGTKNNGVRVNPSLYVLRRTQMPAILVELAYITNENDVQKLVNDQYAFAYAIYEGLCRYLGLTPTVGA